MEEKAFAGEFETHLTVRLDEAERIEALRSWACERGLKCLHIVLDRGESASQPMLTRHSRGDLATERTAASAIREALEDAGFPVTRIKLEVLPENLGVPQSAREAVEHSPNRYFEHHVKLLLGPEADTAALAEIAEAHNAHLSRNALKRRAEGLQERFVTQRCREVGREEARRRLETLLQELKALGPPVLEIEEEFVVYDSNLALDAGWIRSEK